MNIKKISILLIILLVLTAVPFLVNAQTSAEVTLGSIDISQFPLINTYMDVRDSQGFFLSGLNSEQVIVLEDGQEIQASEVIEMRVGAQVVVALNLGTAINVYDDKGFRRIDYISEALSSWIDSGEADSLDTYSFISSEGVLLSHTINGNEWARTFQAYQPEISVLPTWDVVSAALDLASDPLPREGMGRALILITPIISVGNSDIVQSLADRARQSGIRLYIGLVDSARYFEREEALQLQSLAIQTGGQYFAFSGFEALPDINAMIESSRRVYQVSYNSKVVEAGQHEFEIVVQAPAGNIHSSFKSFSLDLRPPNPFFLSPPSQIIRTVADGLELEPHNLFPRQETVQIMIEFPDNIEREIVNSTLYINGEFVAENIEPPFTEFTFDLSPYESSQQLMMRVEAFDELGLFGSSIDTPLNILVEYPVQTLSTLLSENMNLLTIGISAFAGIALLLILLLGGQLRPARFGDGLRRRKRDRDPIIQANMAIEPQRKQISGRNNFQTLILNMKNKLPWVSSKSAYKVPAFLVSLTNEPDLEAGIKFPIVSKEVIIGSSPEQSGIRLDNAAVNGQHARLWQNEKGEFQLEDLNSVAGTWLNYSKMSAEAQKLSHGDLLHIANIGFRFLLSKPPTLNQAKIIQLEEKI